MCNQLPSAVVLRATTYDKANLLDCTVQANSPHSYLLGCNEDNLLLLFQVGANR
jgi:hypothetical protein